MQRPWIKMSSTCLINLDYVAKVIRKSDAAEGIILFHASAGTSASQRFDYINATTADAKFAEIMSHLANQSSMVDLSA